MRPLELAVVRSSEKDNWGSEDGEIQMDAGHLVFRSCTELLIGWPDY